MASGNLRLSLTSWLSRLLQIILFCVHQQDKLQAHMLTTQECILRLTGVWFSVQIVRAEMAASVASAEQEVKRLEQQLAGSQAAAAQQLEEIKKVHQRELKSQVQAACISLPTLLMRPPPPTCLPPPPPQPACLPPPTSSPQTSPSPKSPPVELLLALLHILMSLAIEPIVLGSPAQVWM